MELSECKTHGLYKHHEYTDHQRQRTRLRCAACLNEAVTRRRRKLKQLAVEYKGGKCEHCGYAAYVEVLEFHHRDPSQRDFGVSASGHTRSFDKIKIELDKCIMLCANCHREEHIRLRIE